MPWQLDALTRTDDIVRAVVELIADGGTAAVTYRAIGARLRLSASTLHDHYPDRRHLMKIVMDKVARQREDMLFGTGWETWSERGDRCHTGLAGTIPDGDDELRHARVWLALRDLARHEDRLGAIVDQARDREHQLIRRELEKTREARGPVTDVDVTVVQAVIEGLTSARTVGGEPLPHARAVELLERTLDALVGRAIGTAT